VDPPVALSNCLFIPGSVGQQHWGLAAGYACLPPLPPPATLDASAVGATISLEWPPSAASQTAQHVEVGRRSEQADVGMVTLGPDQTAISGVLPPGSYNARVRVVDGTAVSMPSPEVSFTIGPPDAPGAPLDLMAITEGLRVRLTWRSPTIGTPRGYLLDVGSGEGRRDVASLGLAAVPTSFAIEAPPGRYWARLRSLGDAGALSGPSGEVFISVDAHPGFCTAPPLAPFDLSTTVTGRTVTLTWQQPATGAVPDTQRVIVGSTPGARNLAAFGVPGPATRFVAPAPPGVYHARVVALNQCGASPDSNEVRIVVQ
jgi:hypothetical protein